MKNLFELSSEEKNRILNLHESATKNQYLMSEQSFKEIGGVSSTQSTSKTSFPKQNIGNQFKFGEYQSNVVKNAIASLKPKIEEFIKNSGGKNFVVNISAGESNVTNPKGFEEKGSLALARANSVKQYFQELFPDLIKNGTLVIKSPVNVSEVIIGKTPYDKIKGDNKNPEKIKLYKQEQFVTFDIQGSGEVENIKSICDWSATITGKTGDVTKNYITASDKLQGKGLLTFDTGSIPDRMVVKNNKGIIVKDTGYVATLPHQYVDFKYVPLYVAELTKLYKTVSVSGDKIITIKVQSFSDLLKQILNSGVKIPDSQRLMDMGESEIYEGVQKLQKLYNSGVREFVIYSINPSSSITPFDSQTGDSDVIVYSPVGKTGYTLTGKC
jgi:predicted peroxiredoxin